MPQRARRALILALPVLLTACARPTPRVMVGPLDAGLDSFLDAHPLPPGLPVRIDEVARTVGASYHVVQARGSERPHRHAAHDLTIVVLRGNGTLRLGALQRRLAAGAAALIPRDTVHWFASDRDPAVALAIFTPPLDAPDTVPVETPRGELSIDSVPGDS